MDLPVFDKGRANGPELTAATNSSFTLNWENFQFVLKGILGSVGNYQLKSINRVLVLGKHCLKAAVLQEIYIHCKS